MLCCRFSPTQLLQQFQKLLPVRRLAYWMHLCAKAFYQRAFTPQITLWYCLFLRLDNDPRLSHAVEDARSGGADRLSPPGKPLSRQLRSAATTSFSDARQRLPLAIFQKTLHHSAARLAADFQRPTWFGYPVALLDGSTLRMRPHGDLPEAFPPHRPGNCKKPPYWCVARVVAGFCLATGAVLDTVIGALKASEQALSATLLQTGTWVNWLLVGDRNFGVYSIVRTAEAVGAKVPVRLTFSRAKKLARLARVRLAAGLDAPLLWTPSAHDQCPEGLARIPVAGRLVVVRVQPPGFRAQTLYLFTTLDASVATAQQLAQLYGRRWRVELYLR